MSSDAASAVLMIRPAAFGRNELTHPSNSFQSAAPDPTPERTAILAQAEFDTCAATLSKAGVDVRIFAGRTSSQLPDEVFPNNWISTHACGTTVLYPMLAPNRRAERRRDVLEKLQQHATGFRIDRIIDLTYLERSNCFLEGTGSLVFDHANRIAFAGLSPRTHVNALREFARVMDYGIITFLATDESGQAIYHTNVMLSLGEQFAVVCPDSVEDVNERFRLLARLERSGREIIELTRAQLGSFCGNLLQLCSGEERLIALSRQALDALDDGQREALARHGRLVSVPVNTIETHGGGSVRCMLAELRLPRKSAPPPPD